MSAMLWERNSGKNDAFYTCKQMHTPFVGDLAEKCEAFSERVGPRIHSLKAMKTCNNYGYCSTSHMALVTEEEDAQRHKLNTGKDVTSTLVLNSLFLLFVLIAFGTCKRRFDFVNLIATAIVVQAIVNVGLFYGWICTWVVEKMVNSLDDCDALEKAMNFTNAHEHNDGLVSIKVHKF